MQLLRGVKAVVFSSNFVSCLLVHTLCVFMEPFKDEEQTALFKDPVRTAL